MQINKRRRFKLSLWLMLALILPCSAPAQKTEPKAEKIISGSLARVETRQLNSKLMAREMPYRVILPLGYEAREKAGERYPVVYLLHGLGGHFDNWTDKTKLAEYAAAFGFIIVMPEGGDGWYTDSATVPNDRYETYIADELIFEIDKKFRTISDRQQRAIAGLSMGGYGAVKFGLKYPDKFVLAGSFSGAFDAASLNEKNSSAWIAKSIMSVFGKDESDTRRTNDIFRIVRELPAEKTSVLPFFYVDCGTEDLFAGNNREFMRLLVEKKIKHEYRQLPGGHTWIYWDAQIREFLRLGERFFQPSKAKGN